MRELDHHWVTDWSQANGESCYTAVVSKERLQVVDEDPGGVGGQLPGTAIGEICDIHLIVSDDPILKVEARGVPGEGEGGGGGTRGSQISRSSSWICRVEMAW